VAVTELLEGAGAQFDPQIVHEFVALRGELERDTA
jgi:hypothetical protein